jgi:hypothetical protein
MRAMDDKLWAIEEIKQLKARYFYHLDLKNWQGWRDEVFTSDVVVDVRNTWDQPLHGIDAFVERVSRNTVGAVTVHHGHMPIITIESADSASGIWAMEDVIHFSPDNPMMGKYTFMHGFGHYHERYVRQSAGWRIAAMRLDRLHLERR